MARLSFLRTREPGLDVLRVVYAGRKLKLKPGHGVRGAKLCDQLFQGVSIVAEPFPQLTIAAGHVGCPVSSLVSQDAVVINPVRELIESGHVYRFGSVRSIERAVVDSHNSIGCRRSDVRPVALRSEVAVNEWFQF